MFWRESRPPQVISLSVLTFPTARQPKTSARVRWQPTKRQALADRRDRKGRTTLVLQPPHFCSYARLTLVSIPTAQPRSATAATEEKEPLVVRGLPSHGKGSWFEPRRFRVSRESCSPALNHARARLFAVSRGLRKIFLFRFCAG